MIDNICLEDAKQLLKKSEELLKKYPNSFSIKVSIKQWKNHIEDLESKLNKEEQHESKKETN